MTDSRPDENTPTTPPGPTPVGDAATRATDTAPGATRPSVPRPAVPPPSRPAPEAGATGAGAGDDASGETADSGGDGTGAGGPPRKRRRRGSRGGRRRKPAGARPEGSDDEFDDEDDATDDATDDGGDAPGSAAGASAPRPADRPRQDRRPSEPRPKQPRQPSTSRPTAESSPSADSPELPERSSEGRASGEAAAAALVPRKPRIGDTRPAPSPAPEQAPAAAEPDPAKKKRRRSGRGGKSKPRPATTAGTADTEVSERRKGRERNGRPVGRYMMAVQVRPNLTQVAVLEGRSLIEHYVSRPADDIGQIHGNIYVGRVQNVLPGMEAAFVDIGTPKNAVLYRGDVQYDSEDIVERGGEPRIEQILKAKQLIVCQVTKNPIGAKGARLTQEVSIPGRFVVLIPNSKTYGISKRLPDDERKRLRTILDRVKPAEHGLIVRTAAEGATEHELRADMTRLLDQWTKIEAKAKKVNGPALLYREPALAVRVIREEFNAEYRGIVIDDPKLYEDVKDYVTAFNPELADRVELFDAEADGLPLYERHHIHEQIHKALDRKVWLPSGGSLIIEHTEALTVIDVNTGKNVGKTNLEETVFRNNLEAAEEIARQLRLRDIGGIIVIDFIDMEIRENRRKVVDAFREALARDKTRTQVFDISELGLVEMTRKRIGEGLLTSFADPCPVCDGRGVQIDHSLLQ